MEKKYFEENEEKDYEQLVAFNEQTNLFSELHQTPTKHYYDVSGLTRDGREVIIELKRRYLNVVSNENDELVISGKTSQGKEFSDDNILLSNHKGLDMLFDAIVDKKIPLYITIANNCVIIHNLLKLKTRPKRYASIKSYSGGYQKFEYDSKQGLYIEDAVIYKINPEGKYIRNE